MTSTNGHHSSDSPPLVEGTLEARNARGVRVNGDWFNVSRFKPVDIPNVGTRVRLGVDGKGFITSLEVVESAPATTSASRNETITRLAVLKAAANFVGLMGQCREDVRSEHVLPLAEKWLAWVTQQ